MPSSLIPIVKLFNGLQTQGVTVSNVSVSVPATKMLSTLRSSKLDYVLVIWRKEAIGTAYVNVIVKRTGVSESHIRLPSDESRR